MKSFVLQNKKPVLSLKEYKEIYNGYFSYRIINNSIVSELENMPIFTRDFFERSLYDIFSNISDDSDDELLINAYSLDYLSFKDRFIILNDPHLLLDGALSFCKILNLKKLRIVIRNIFEKEYKTLINAVKELRDEGYAADIKIFIDKDAKITYYDLQNAKYAFDTESVIQFAHFAHLGSIRFKNYGKRNYKGTVLSSVTGDIKEVGLYEVELSTFLNDVINMAGKTKRGSSIKCVFTNGFFNPPIDEYTAKVLKLDYDSFLDLNMCLGSGNICVIAEDTCIIRVVLKIVSFATDSICGNCMPCKFGFILLKDYLNLILLGRASSDVYIEMENTAKMICKGAICSQVSAIANCILCTLDMFKEEIFFAIENKTTMYSFYKEYN